MGVLWQCCCHFIFCDDLLPTFCALLCFVLKNVSEIIYAEDSFISGFRLFCGVHG